MKRVKNKKFLISIGVLFISYVFARMFLVDVYKIRSSSMENTFHDGDITLVSKIHYGPLLPQSFSEIPILDLFVKSKGASWQSRRVFENNDIQRGDIVVLKDKFLSAKKLIKRCVLIPGDSLLFTNGRLLEYTENILDVHKDAVLIIIPSRGKTVRFENRHVLNVYQEITNEIDLTKYNLDSARSLEHKFDQDYFYVLGDNKKASIDSRQFGLVPKRSIIGKALSF